MGDSGTKSVSVSIALRAREQGTGNRQQATVDDDKVSASSYVLTLMRSAIAVQNFWVIIVAYLLNFEAHRSEHGAIYSLM